MTAEKMSFVLPVPDLAAAAFWARVLGVEPTFVDGDRWAQFDHGGARLSLAGTDRTADVPGTLVKVSDLGAACDELRAACLEVSDITAGPHEHRAVVTGPGGWPVTLYTPAPRPS